MLKDNIKKIREDLNISQRELARRITMSGQMISKIERGETTPSLETLNKIATALDVTVNDLISYEERRNAEKLKDIDKLLEKLPQYKENILDIFGSVYETIDAEFYKPSSLKSSDPVMQTLDFNIELYLELFKTILTLSNSNPFIMDYICDKKFAQLYALKDRKLSEMTEIINKIFNNYLVRYGIDNVKPQGITDNKEGE